MVLKMFVVIWNFQKYNRPTLKLKKSGVDPHFQCMILRNNNLLVFIYNKGHCRAIHLKDVNVCN